MKIIKKYGLTMTLTIAVIISFVLSIVLWINPAYEHVKRSHNGAARSNLISRPLSYTYAPTQAIQTSKNHNQGILTSSSVNIISEIVDHLRYERVTHLKRISHGSVDRYLRYVNRPRSLALNYQDDITTPILNSVVKGGLSRLPNRRFDRLVIPLNNSHYFYLMRDHGHQVYKVSAWLKSFKKLRQIIDSNHHQIRVKVKLHHDQPFISYPQSIQMPQYDYLINRQSRDYYVTHLLNGTQRISRTARRGRTIYSNGSDRRLQFGKYRDVKYINDRSIRKTHGLNQTLYDSYHSVLPLNLSLNGVHYFGYSPHRHSVLYRRFVEGFPIFNQTQFGILKVAHDNGSLVFNYSLNSLQIPIPNNRKPVRLPNSQQVLSTLRAYGYHPDKVQALEIGYKWQSAKTSEILANLVPEWFIKYNHRWINYNQIKAEK